MSGSLKDATTRLVCWPGDRVTNEIKQDAGWRVGCLTPPPTETKHETEHGDATGNGYSDRGSTPLASTSLISKEVDETEGEKGTIVGTRPPFSVLFHARTFVLG
jgi:hypothetical protein